jgi:hypothetical protein
LITCCATAFNIEQNVSKIAKMYFFWNFIAC